MELTKRSLKHLLTERQKKVVMSIVFAATVGAGYLYYTEGNRNRPDFAGLEFDIQMAQQEKSLLESTSAMPSVYKQWEAAKFIASQHGVEMEAIPEGSPYSVDPSMVDGGHMWQGALSGEPTKVYMASMEIQKRIPTLLGNGAIDAGKAVQVVGIIGAPPSKYNSN